MFSREIAQRFKDKTIRLCDLEKLLVMHDEESDPSERVGLFVDVCLAMHLLTKRKEASFDLEWMKAHLEPPTHIWIGEDAEKDLVYRHTEECVGFLGLSDRLFSCYSQTCCCEDWDTFWSSCTPCSNWDDAEAAIAGHASE